MKTKISLPSFADFYIPLWWITMIFLLLVAFSACRERPADSISSDRRPKIEPDYSDVIIPPNIAPLNFKINEKGCGYYVIFSAASSPEVKIFSHDGRIAVPGRKWKKLINNNKGKNLKIKVFAKDQKKKWHEFKTITNLISEEPIDRYVYYRSIYPGFESWSGLSIHCRDLESFRDLPFIENSVLDGNCVNCHSFNNGKTTDFLFHVRGKSGGTYFNKDGKFIKFNLKADQMKNGAVYPRWHPSGNYVAFSSNNIIQQFHAGENKKVEVTDLESSLVLYDVKKNEMMMIDIPGSSKVMDTYPEWSPDGSQLYFCRTSQIEEKFEYNQIRYDLYRITFKSEDRTFGEAELVYDAASLNKSVSFPRISPDGKFLVMTLSDYGCFPIWHKEADLYLLNLETMETSRMNLNSDFAESYHSWSSNSKWLIFSSKRDDGLTALPYIAGIEDSGNSGKPFLLPQKDPGVYASSMKSYNIPEFSTFKVERTPGQLRKAGLRESTKVKWVNR